MDPVVVTTSLDQQCNIYSMAEGETLQLLWHTSQANVPEYSL